MQNGVPMNTLYYGDNLEILRRGVGVRGDAEYEIVLMRQTRMSVLPPWALGSKNLDSGSG
ncbi:MAG TPA: hypothetical protein VF398_11355 [bacterium]|jgi:hypothetical protein